jgi:hypothetical protein
MDKLYTLARLVDLWAMVALVLAFVIHELINQQLNDTRRGANAKSAIEVEHPWTPTTILKNATFTGAGD